MYDSIIIGAGPAGLTSAIYLRRANKKVLVLEAKGCGGQIANADKVENYPGIAQISGFELADNLYRQAKNMGAEIKFEKVNAVQQDKTVQTNGGTYRGKTVIIANGAAKRRLNLKKEADFIGKGVSYCATCDGAFFKNRDVCVIGGSDVAVEDAIFLSRTCNKVYLVHRRNELRAADLLQKELLAKDNVEIIWDSNVSELIGEDELSGLVIKNNKTDETRELEVEGLFIAVGINPVTEMFRGLIDMDAQGYIIAGEDCRTNVSGIFVAGDARRKPLRQIVTAVADGANAIESIQKL